jgi:tryptophan-rich sensory protein
MLVPGDDMNKANLKTYAFWIGLSESVGLLSGFLTRQGTEIYANMLQKPPLSPPGWVFAVVWTVLYALMGISAARIYAAPPSRARSRGLNLFIVQLVVNFFWSPIFFNAGAYGFALLWLLLLWALVALMILQFSKVDKTAALLQIPYLLWLTFAAYLNYGVWQLNR